MRAKRINNIKLGVFVLAGLFLLILGLYLVGRKQNLFGSNITIKARFENVSGLKIGNNVRYAGIEVGTVQDIYILNDSLVEVVMLVQERMQQVMKKNAIVAIGNDGLMGNKVINITAGNGDAKFINDGDLLVVQAGAGTEEIMERLGKTAEDVSEIAGTLKQTINRVNESVALWKILNDETLPANISSSLANVKQATARADQFVGTLNLMLADVRSGKGSLGSVLKDTALVYELEQAVQKVKEAGSQAKQVGADMSMLVNNIHNEVTDGKGLVNAALKDTGMVHSVNRSLNNIEAATISLNENLEALKHNFLFRGYFRRLERQKQKAAEQK